MSTPHNTAQKGEIEKIVIMPGDPRRAKHIAKNYLENPVLINSVREIYAYSGQYKGVPITVMASGMGIPSMAIYSWELFNEYEAEVIMRIGTAGAYQEDVNLGDIVIAQAACTDSNYVKGFGLPGTFAPIGDYELISMAVETSKEHNKNVKVGNILSSDIFYYSDGRESERELWKNMGILVAEMETAGLYANAAYFKKKALTICTVTDNLAKGEAMPAEQRELGLNNMIEIALDTAVKFALSRKKD